MLFELGIGIGFSLGIVAGLQFSRIIWPEYTESVWDKKKRENQMVEEAIEIYKRKLNESSEPQG